MKPIMKFATESQLSTSEVESAQLRPVRCSRQASSCAARGASFPRPRGFLFLLRRGAAASLAALTACAAAPVAPHEAPPALTPCSPAPARPAPAPPAGCRRPRHPPHTTASLHIEIAPAAGGGGVAVGGDGAAGAGARLRLPPVPAGGPCPRGGAGLRQSGIELAVSERGGL